VPADWTRTRTKPCAARLETWICEHFAWLIAWRRPHEALLIAEEALLLAEQLQSPIEIGRALATRALAGIGTRVKDDVVADLQKSLEHVERAGFRSDALNPLLVYVFLHCLAGDIESAQMTRRKITGITQELNVHRECDVISAWWIEWVSGRREPIEEVSIQWLGEVDVIRRRWIGILTARLALMS
jgi:hypothetical protein